MYFRSTLSGTLAVLLVSSAAAIAAQHQGGADVSAPRTGLFGIFERKADDVRVAQASDPRVMQLEEQVRSLNGKIEDLNFQILQMQEQMRKMQEDNEFRLQELEKKAGIDSGADRNVAGASPSGDAQPGQNDTSMAEAPPADAQPGDNATTSGNSGEKPAGRGEPQQTFGTITVDKDGNVTSSTADQPIDLLPPSNGAQGADNTDVAALPKTDDPEELYRNSYQSILSGDYRNAEAGFRDHIARFPSDSKVADSNYWLGESLLGQQKYNEAAEVFLAAGKQYPKAKKAPDMLLKLGVSLVGMNQKDVACATFTEVGKRYPGASDALKQRVKQEQALAAC